MTNLTPMMAQYRTVREKYKDCIVMFRLGDFYEMFFEDALKASKILQITLTSRGKTEGQKIPMCGIPFHAVDQYLPKLTRAGEKVAICEQVTEPNGHGIVQREVVRIVTPGTTFDDNILDKKSNNYVSCFVFENGSFGFAYADVTTGDFIVTEIKGISEFEAEIMRVRPAECICDEALMKNSLINAILKKVNGLCTFPYSYSKDAESSLTGYFGIKSLDVFGLKDEGLAISAAGMLFEYLRETQKTDLKHVQKISYRNMSEFMPLDEALIRNLELFGTSREGKKEGSFISAIDNTVTAMGGRLLRNWLLNPLIVKADIDERLKKVGVFVKNSSLLRSVREQLNNLHDIERLLSRLSLGTGNARDLIAMNASLKIVPSVKNLISQIPEFSLLSSDLFELKELISLIDRAIKDECPLTVREGGMIKKGFNEELDFLMSISTEGKTFIKNLQEREIKRTGINSLKVRFNTVFGYYIEISKANLSSVPEDYMRKQTLVNAERFITPELKEYEEKVLTAEEKIKELEYKLFYEVRMEVVKNIMQIQKIAKAISVLDVVTCFAFNAEKNNYCRPEILNENVIEIMEGRHPVIEQINTVKNFVPNDCKIDNENNFLLITGPNMGGKSTYLRQIALIVLMAQIGSYVPAESAKIGICDRIFTRVGASDNLARGESTFMVEMQEAAYILNNATEKSLIILDEIGRGTSTYDGVSIAWAITEFIHDKLKSKTLFATHYHELIELVEKLSRAQNLSVYVRENEIEGVVFLYKVIEGGVDKSYGIEVAKLAGLPVDIVSRARGVLHELELKNIQKSRVSPDQMGLFAQIREHNKISESDKKMLEDLKNIDVDNITPFEALKKLNEIKRK